ncbi:ATPase, T2SS/T4P/T4SS family, partial [Klebsiella pneumoniae]
REIGRDCEDYQQGLTAALRQDPDVIMLGELRDEAAIRLALTAAETGHLVLSTLHTRGAIAAIERLTDVFSGAEKNRVCSQLAG